MLQADGSAYNARGSPCWGEGRLLGPASSPAPGLRGGAGGFKGASGPLGGNLLSVVLSAQRWRLPAEGRAACDSRLRPPSVAVGSLQGCRRTTAVPKCDDVGASNDIGRQRHGASPGGGEGLTWYLLGYLD